MKINLKHSKTRWVDIDEESQFLIDYPTIEQAEDMKELQYQMALIDDSLLQAIDQEAREKIMNNLSGKQKAQMLILSERLYKRTIKYCVKGWKGVGDTEGNDVECKIINNEMEDRLFEGLIRELSLDNLAHIYTCINEETELTETDKKKL
jgi:hypothetical protein